jgi:hypothetical protein
VTRPRRRRPADLRPSGSRGALVVRAAVGVLAVAVAAGCSVSTDEPRVVGARFAAAVEAGRLDDACALLTPSARDDALAAASATGLAVASCGEALDLLSLQAPGEVTAAETWGRASLVTFTGDTAFLARTGDTWQVRAVGCTAPSEDRPAECTVDGS